MKTETKKQMLLTGVAAVITLALWALDYVVPFEVSMFVIYLIPIGVAAHLGLPHSGYALAALSAVAWFVSNNGVDPRLQGVLGVWNIFTRLAVFFGLAFYAERLRMAHAMERAAREAAAVAPSVPQLVCEQCSKVSDKGGEWNSPLEFLKKAGEGKLHLCICPNCIGEFLARDPRKEAPKP